MEYAEARRLLLLHGPGTYDADGRPLVLEDGFLGSLRPYSGLHGGRYGGEAAERARPVADVAVLRVRGLDRRLAAGLSPPDEYEAVWLLKGQRPQDRGVDDGKHGGHGRDA